MKCHGIQNKGPGTNRTDYDRFLWRDHSKGKCNEREDGEDCDLHDFDDFQLYSGLLCCIVGDVLKEGK